METKSHCTKCSRHCTPATDADTCPACRLLLDTARAANRRSRRLKAFAAACAAVGLFCAIVAVLAYI